MQPRSDFAPGRLEELIHSIREKGVIQPVLVRRLSPDSYELIAGERRLRAVTHLNIEEIPAIIHEVDDAGALELSLIENLQREDLNPIEQARAYKRLNQEFNYSHDQIAAKIGRERSSVTNILRLLKLPEPIQRGVADGTITPGHARAILSLKGLEAQLKMYDQIIAGKFSVRESEVATQPGRTKRRRGKAHLEKDPHLLSVEEELQRILGSKVTIVAGRKRGRIIIEYYSPDDLERIIKVLEG